jgi:hypothetical protein
LLKVYFLGTQSALQDQLATQFQWSNGESIVHEPPAQEASEGGEPSVPGLGGAGGQGLAGDPFGVCQSGAAGELGLPGPSGKKGKIGPTPLQGSPAALTALTLF